jgi:hypothetical protein
MPELSDLHREYCDGTDHVPPVGETEGQVWDGSHGEPLSGGQLEQCMCGHWSYFWCPDYFVRDDAAAGLAVLADGIAARRGRNPINREETDCG